MWNIVNEPLIYIWATSFFILNKCFIVLVYCFFELVPIHFYYTNIFFCVFYKRKQVNNDRINFFGWTVPLRWLSLVLCQLEQWLSLNESSGIYADICILPTDSFLHQLVRYAKFKWQLNATRLVNIFSLTLWSVSEKRSY